MAKGFNAGTLVFTENGFVPIENVKIGDRVLTHKRRFKPVLGVNVTEGPTIQIKSSATYDVYAGEEQEIYISSFNRVWANYKRSWDRIFSDFYWVPTRDLVTTTNFVISTTAEHNIEEKGDNIFWKFVGRYTGDGWYRHDKRKGRKNSYMYYVIICCAKDERNELIDLFNALGYHYNITEKRTVLQFRITRQELWEKISLIGSGAFNKIIHPWLWNESREHQRAYIQGYYDSDGHYEESRNVYNISSVSKKAIYGVKQLVSEVEPVAVPQITCCHRPPTCIIEGRVVNQRDSLTARWKTDLRKQDHNFQRDNYLYQQIRKLIPSDNKQLYSLQVKDDESYTVDTIIVRS